MKSKVFTMAAGLGILLTIELTFHVSHYILPYNPTSWKAGYEQGFKAAMDSLVISVRR